MVYYDPTWKMKPRYLISTVLFTGVTPHASSFAALCVAATPCAKFGAIANCHMLTARRCARTLVTLPASTLFWRTPVAVAGCGALRPHYVLAPL